jgi:hypothetical protein
MNPSSYKTGPTPLLKNRKIATLLCSWKKSHAKISSSFTRIRPRPFTKKLLEKSAKLTGPDKKKKKNLASSPKCKCK